MDQSFTVSQIGRWMFVVGKPDQIDHLSLCPLCGPKRGHNRVRLGPAREEVELVTCPHFLKYEYRASERVIYFVFSVSGADLPSA